MSKRKTEKERNRNRTGRFCKIVVFAPFPHEKAQSHLKYYPLLRNAIRQTKTIKNQKWKIFRLPLTADSATSGEKLLSAK